MLKFDKVIMITVLIILLFLILTLGYLFVKSKLDPEVNVMEQKNFIEEENIINLNKEKEIKNPSEKDISNLIDVLKDQNAQLNIE